MSQPLSHIQGNYKYDSHQYCNNLTSFNNFQHTWLTFVLRLGKSIGSGKKLFKHLQKQYEADHQILEQAKAYFQRHLNAEKRASTNDQTLMNDSSESDVGAISTSPEFGSISSFCDSKGMNEQQTRKMRFYLISTLNAAFPDYDFRYPTNVMVYSLKVQYDLPTSRNSR